jgi:spore coat polysaccharide biosynthesis protein SpsF
VGHVAGLSGKIFKPRFMAVKMNHKIIAIIQARMGSTRLPGKVLMPIVDRPVLWHIVNRLKYVKPIDGIVVATSALQQDDAINKFCSREQVTCIRGSERDVLDRFYQAASAAQADIIIRITGDCPLIDPILITRLLDFQKQNALDYCGIAAGAGVASDGFYGRYPDGLDAEVFSMDALETAWKEADGDLYREHVTPYLWKHPDRFKTGVFKCRGRDFSGLRWTLDNIEDYRLISKIYEMLFAENPSFGLDDVLDLMTRTPDMFKENQQYVGKEGYENFWN